MFLTCRLFLHLRFCERVLLLQLFWNSQLKPAPGANLLVDIFGQYDATKGSRAVGGLAYYVSSPQNLQGVADDPLRALVYLGILVAFCAVFSLIWLEVGGLGPAKVAQQLMDSGMEIPGYRRSGKPIELILKRYIPVVTILGGVVVALIAGLSDFFGAFGSGTGILLSVGIIYQYYELLMRERAAEMFPAFRRILGE
jgi:preprotein translocase subunit SecY